MPDGQCCLSSLIALARKDPSCPTFDVVKAQFLTVSKNGMLSVEQMLTLSRILGFTFQDAFGLYDGMKAIKIENLNNKSVNGMNPLFPAITYVIKEGWQHTGVLLGGKNMYK